MPSSSVKSVEEAVAGLLEALMVDIAKISGRSRALNITMGVLVTLAKFLNTNNLQGLSRLARLCDSELNTIRSQESTSEFLAQMDEREQQLGAIAEQAIKKYPLL